MNTASKRRLVRWLALAVALATLTACGHRKAPSGGPVDTTPPEVLSIDPAPLGEIGDRITVVFSKPIDRATALTGVRLYPPIVDRKFRWPDQQTMVIDLREKLADDTNYTLWLGRELKDTHANALEEPLTYVFRHGELQTGRIAGTFDWAEPGHAGLTVNLDLFSADTTFVAGWNVTGSTFVIEHLNIEPHLLRAWGDVGDDDRYKYGLDPRVEVTTDSLERVSLKLEMAVEDTLAPSMKSGLSVTDRQTTVTFSEPLRRVTSVELIGVDSTAVSQPVIASVLRGDELRLLTPPAPEGRYMIRAQGIVDLRGNATDIDSIFIETTVRPDSIAPAIFDVSPRNGAVLAEARPLVTVRFSEIVLAEDVVFRFLRDDTNVETAATVRQNAGDEYVLQPVNALESYATYRLEIDAADAAGNRLDSAIPYRWIHVPPQEQ